MAAISRRHFQMYFLEWKCMNLISHHWFEIWNNGLLSNKPMKTRSWSPFSNLHIHHSALQAVYTITILYLKGFTNWAIQAVYTIKYLNLNELINWSQPISLNNTSTSIPLSCVHGNDTSPGSPFMNTLINAGILGSSHTHTLALHVCAMRL